MNNLIKEVSLMADIKKMRELLKNGDPTVFLKVKLGEGSFVDERSSWTFWDDVNQVVYTIRLPDSVAVNMAYDYNNGNTPMDMANYKRSLKADARIFVVQAYTYDSIIGMQAVYDKSMSMNLMDQFVSTLSGDEKDNLIAMKEKFEQACRNMDKVETYLTTGYPSTDKDYNSSTMY